MHKTKVEPPKPVPHELTQADIDLNIMGSFPASDPPSWTMGNDHLKKKPKGPPKNEDRDS